MNHKRYIRAKLREMGSSTLSLNQGISKIENQSKLYNVRSDNEPQNNTLYNFSYQNTLNDQSSPKGESIENRVKYSLN